MPACINIDLSRPRLKILGAPQAWQYSDQLRAAAGTNYDINENAKNPILCWKSRVSC